jgi:hypothetical protein
LRADQREGRDAEAEEGPDTEHEMVPAEDPNESNETFAPRSGVDARIIDRMNKLAAILKNENAIREEMKEVDEGAEGENGSRK